MRSAAKYLPSLGALIAGGALIVAQPRWLAYARGLFRLAGRAAWRERLPLEDCPHTCRELRDDRRFGRIGAVRAAPGDA